MVCKNWYLDFMDFLVFALASNHGICQIKLYKKYIKDKFTAVMNNE